MQNIGSSTSALELAERRLAEISMDVLNLATSVYIRDGVYEAFMVLNGSGAIGAYCYGVKELFMPARAGVEESPPYCVFFVVYAVELSYFTDLTGRLCDMVHI